MYKNEKEAMNATKEEAKRQAKKQAKKMVRKAILTAVKAVIIPALPYILVVALSVFVIAAITDFLSGDGDNPILYEEEFKTISEGNGVLWDIQNPLFSKSEFIQMVEDYYNNVSTSTGESGRTQQEGYEQCFINYAEVFYDAATSNEMDPRFIFCIAIHESGFGTSNLTVTNNNMFGWKGGTSWSSWDDVGEGIQTISYYLRGWTDGTRDSSFQYNLIIENGYNPTTIEGIGSVYCTDGTDWSGMVIAHMESIFGYIPIESPENTYVGDTEYTYNGTDNLSTNPSEAEIQEKIVNVALNYRTYGISAGDGMCLKWVNDVYDKAGAPVIRVCCAAHAGYLYGVSKNFNNMPVGALTFGGPTSGNGYGHVGIYIGDGNIIHNYNGVVKTWSVSEWMSHYSSAECGWGWASTTPVVSKYPVRQGILPDHNH